MNDRPRTSGFDRFSVDDSTVPGSLKPIVGGSGLPSKYVGRKIPYHGLSLQVRQFSTVKKGNT
jgi:hypothetical protein